MEFYFTIEQKAQAEFKDRGSRFIAFAAPIQTVDEFKTFLKELKAEHPKAVQLSIPKRCIIVLLIG